MRCSGRCEFYSLEEVIVGFNKGDIEDPMYEKFEMCKKNGIGCCYHSGINQECEVFNDEKEKLD